MSSQIIGVTPIDGLRFLRAILCCTDWFVSFNIVVGCCSSVKIGLSPFFVAVTILVAVVDISVVVVATGGMEVGVSVVEMLGRPLYWLPDGLA